MGRRVTVDRRTRRIPDAEYPEEAGARQRTDTGGARLNVLFLTRKWPPAVGGMETYCVEITRELERSVTLTLCALPGRSDGSTPGPAAIAGFATRTAASVLLGKRQDVIHVADIASWPLALMARLRSPEAAVVLSAHGTDVSFPDRSGVGPALYRIYVKLGSRMLRRAMVLANSTATAARATALGFRSVRTIPLGTRAIGPRSLPRKPARFVLFAGRLVRRKGFQWFAREVLPLLQEGITVKVAGTIWDDQERAFLESDRICYLGPVPRERLGNLMAEALCVVIPNIPVGPGHFEGFGLVAVEAAAAGGVVIAPRTDGFTDSVISEITGFLLKPMSATAWAAKINEIAAWSPDTRHAFVARASARASDHFSWERTAEQTLSSYRTALQ